MIYYDDDDDDYYYYYYYYYDYYYYYFEPTWPHERNQLRAYCLRAAPRWAVQARAKPTTVIQVCRLAGHLIMIDPSALMRAPDGAQTMPAKSRKSLCALPF